MSGKYRVVAVVSKGEEVERALEVKPAWEWESFGYGMLAGFLVTVGVGGVILYFNWPYIVGAMKTVPVFKVMVEEAKRVGLF